MKNTCRDCKHLGQRFSGPNCNLFNGTSDSLCLDSRLFESEKPLIPKPKKPPYNYAAASALFFFLVYACFSFVLNTLDATQWTSSERAGMIIMFVICMIVDLVVYYENKEK